MQSEGYIPDAEDTAYIEASAGPSTPSSWRSRRRPWAGTARYRSWIAPRSRAGRARGGAATHRGGGHGLRLLDAVDGAGPAAGRHDRDHRPRPDRTARARAWWREAGVADERITVVSRPALEAFAADEPALRGPVRPGLHRRPEGGVRGVPGRAATAPRAARPGRRRQRPVERPRGPTRPRRRRLDRGPARLQRRGAARPAMARDDPAGRRRPAVATPPDARRGACRDRARPGSIQTSDLATGSRVTILRLPRNPIPTCPASPRGPAARDPRPLAPGPPPRRSISGASGSPTRSASSARRSAPSPCPTRPSSSWTRARPRWAAGDGRVPALPALHPAGRRVDRPAASAGRSSSPATWAAPSPLSQHPRRLRPGRPDHLAALRGRLPLGLLTVFFDGAYQSYLPAIVAARRAHRGQRQAADQRLERRRSPASPWPGPWSSWWPPR